MKSNSSNDGQYLQYGIEKIINTYYLTGNLEYNNDTEYGIINFKQNYSGTSLRFAESSFRDNEDLHFKYLMPIFKNIRLVSGVNWLLSSDSKSIGINKLEKQNATAGLSYYLNEKNFAEASFGLEKNNQVGIISYGPFFSAKSMFNNLDLDSYIANTDLNAELVSLNYGRLNTAVYLNSDISKQFDNDSRIALNLRYRMIGTNDLKFMTSAAFNDYNVENRLEHNIATDLNINFKVFDMPVDMRLIFNNMNSDKSYSKYLSEYELTGVSRNRNLQQIGFQTQIRYVTSALNIQNGIAFDLTSDENNIFNDFGINPDRENLLKNTEFQRDFSESTTRYFNHSEITFSTSDQLKFNVSLSLLRKDTPSNQNFDDHDIFLMFAGVEYKHIFSPILTASLNLGTHMTHLVYIKAQRSASNNWIRILRFSPRIEYSTSILKMMPQFELLANYTVYDFEDITPGINSLSQRQIFYKDSIIISLNKTFNLETNLFIRYFERGVLYWNSFSESPQIKYSEQFTLIMLRAILSDNFSCAVGSRYFKVNQGRLSIGSGSGSMNDVDNLMIGPEVDVDIRFISGNSLKLHGWYEVSYKNDIRSNGMLNVFLMTRINL